MPHMRKVRACRLDMRSGAMPSASPAVLARKMVENPVHMPIHVTMISARRPACRAASAAFGNGEAREREREREQAGALICAACVRVGRGLGKSPAFSMIAIAMKVIVRLTSERSVVAS